MHAPKSTKCVPSVGKSSALRSAEQSEISRYWYESSPQGWNRVAREVEAARGLDEWQSARLFALVNLAMADGFIGGFEAKYHFNYWRPATAIRENAGDHGHTSWLSDLDTPPVPDYPSTHTVLGAAAAAVLAAVFRHGHGVLLHDERGALRRHYAPVLELLRGGAGERRFTHPGGHPLPSAVRAGYVQGDLIGAWTYDRALRTVRAD